jgi:hypothetical protein
MSTAIHPDPRYRHLPVVRPPAQRLTPDALWFRSIHQTKHPDPRYPCGSKEKRVTIAAGFHFDGGVLLCADSEYVGYGHTVHDAKVFSFECPAGKVAFTFAGNAGFAKAAIHRCKQAVGSLQPGAQNPSMFDVIARSVEKEYRRQILSVPSYASDSSYAYRLLISAWSPQQPLTLYVTDGPSIWPVDEYECIGVGEPIAHFLLNPLLEVNPSTMSLDRLLVVVAYALYKIKKFVPACGGMSRFFGMFSDGSCGEPRWWETLLMEDVFDPLDTIFSVILSSATRHSSTDAEFQEAVDAIVGDMRSMRDKFNEIPRSAAIDKLLEGIRSRK